MQIWCYTVDIVLQLTIFNFIQQIVLASLMSKSSILAFAKLQSFN